jgi:hypothetical protein
MKNIILSIAGLCTFCALSAGLCAFGQKGVPDEDVHARLLSGRKRSLIAYAGEYHSFTMDVAGKEVKPSDIPGFITIDKQIIQSTLIPVDRSIDLSRPRPSREKDVLIRYMNYELGYYKKKLKQDYSHLQTEWVTLQGRLFLVWYFDMPKDYKLVSRQVYFSTLFFDQVMDLNAPVFKAGDFGHAKAILARLAAAMKTYDRKLDLGALQKKLDRPA